MAHLHLVCLCLLQLFLQALLLVSEGFKGQHDLLDLVFTLLKHLFLFTILGVESLALTTALLFVPSRVFNLSVLNFD